MTAEIGTTDPGMQYWFVWVILAIGIILLIAFNIIAYIYFTKNNPVDPLKIVPELDKKEKVNKTLRQTERFTSALNPDRVKSPSDPNALMKGLAFDNDNDDIQEFRNEALAYHNVQREKHNAQPLQYSNQLSTYAQYWAEYMAGEGKLMNSTEQWRRKFNNEIIGENIASTINYKISGKAMTDMWYSENLNHNYALDDVQKKSKSFSQLVWNESNLVGFGRAKNKSGNWYVCAHYFPCGNITGKFLNNVNPSKVKL